MLGLHFMDEVPFREVFIHGLVRDEAGAQDVQDQGQRDRPARPSGDYGADALRFALVASTCQGRDIKFGAGRVEGYRNFVTKLWNAARFLQLNEAAARARFRSPAAGCRSTAGSSARPPRPLPRSPRRSTTYRFNEAANTLYRFVWDGFCDWYVELAKPILAGEDAAGAAETRAAAAWALARTLHLLHPITPFVTEELWQRRSRRTRRAS